MFFNHGRVLKFGAPSRCLKSKEIILSELDFFQREGAGGARAPPEFGGSEKGEAWFLLIGV